MLLEKYFFVFMVEDLFIFFFKKKKICLYFRGKNIVYGWLKGGINMSRKNKWLNLKINCIWWEFIMRYLNMYMWYEDK